MLHDSRGISTAEEWHNEPCSGCGIRLWYILVRTAKTMVLNGYNVEKTLDFLRYNRADLGLVKMFMKKEWFILVAGRLSELINVEITEGKYTIDDLTRKTIWISPMYLAQLRDLLMADFHGDFARDYPPEFNEPGTWMPKVLDSLTTHLYNGTFKFIPYYRPGVAIVNTVFTHTGYDASSDLAPVKFVHEE